MSDFFNTSNKIDPNKAWEHAQRIADAANTLCPGMGWVPAKRPHEGLRPIDVMYCGIAVRDTSNGVMVLDYVPATVAEVGEAFAALPHVLEGLERGGVA